MSLSTLLLAITAFNSDSAREMAADEREFREQQQEIKHLLYELCRQLAMPMEEEDAPKELKRIQGLLRKIPPKNFFDFESKDKYYQALRLIEEKLCSFAESELDAIAGKTARPELLTRPEKRELWRRLAIFEPPECGEPETVGKGKMLAEKQTQLWGRFVSCMKAEDPEYPLYFELVMKFRKYGAKASPRQMDLLVYCRCLETLEQYDEFRRSYPDFEADAEDDFAADAAKIDKFLSDQRNRALMGKHLFRMFEKDGNIPEELCGELSIAEKQLGLWHGHSIRHCKTLLRLPGYPEMKDGERDLFLNAAKRLAKQSGDPGKNALAEELRQHYKPSPLKTSPLPKPPPSILPSRQGESASSAKPPPELISSKTPAERNRALISKYLFLMTQQHGEVPESLQRSLRAHAKCLGVGKICDGDNLRALAALPGYPEFSNGLRLRHFMSSLCALLDKSDPSKRAILEELRSHYCRTLQRASGPGLEELRPKSRTIAMLLALCLPGIQEFYLRKSGLGVLLLCITVLSFGLLLPLIGFVSVWRTFFRIRDGRGIPLQLGEHMIVNGLLLIIGSIWFVIWIIMVGFVVPFKHHP